MSSVVTSAPSASGPPANWPGLKTHVPELDGVRGLAVSLVVFYHLHALAGVGGGGTIYGWFASLGWSGVDLFFVLSGFLITGILLDSRTRQKYFQKFYARRILRIFPLYYLLVTAVFLAGPPLLKHASNSAYLIDAWVRPNSQVFAWTYTLNFPFAFSPSRVSILMHPLWSLSIEEQFYLIWPLTVYLLPARVLRVLCFSLVGSALAVRIAFVVLGRASVAYALTPCRTDALALGALLALTVRTPGGLETIGRWGWKLSSAALAAIVTTAAIRGTQNTDPVIVTLGISLLAIFYVSVLGAVISAPAESIARRGLRLSAFRFLGKYSYAIYMFHQAIITAFLVGKLTPVRLATILHSTLAGGFAFSAIICAVTLLAAMASWWLLEKRFLALKRAFNY